MIGRRFAALLCVLLAHVLFILALRLHRPEMRDREAEFAGEPITLYLPPLPPEESAPRPAHAPAPSTPQRAAAPAATTPAAPAESAAITLPGRVDWPLEGQKSAEREVARQVEAERI